MKRALCLLLICLFCAGCSALPPEERAFCVVLLVDGGAQECTVRVRIPTYQQNGGYQTLSATGATLTDALRTLESAAPMRLHWGQLRLIVLSRAWAAEIPIVRTLSDLSGVENLRLHASVAVTEEDTTALAEKLVPESGTRLSKSIDVMVQARHEQGVIPTCAASVLLRFGSRQSPVLWRRRKHGGRPPAQRRVADGCGRACPRLPDAGGNADSAADAGRTDPDAAASARTRDSPDGNKHEYSPNGEYRRLPREPALRPC